MSAEHKISTLTLEKAAADLKEFKKVYESSMKKRTNISTAINKRKIKKLQYEMDIDKNTKTLLYYQNLYVNVSTKLEDIQLIQNNIALQKMSNLEKLVQMEANFKNNLELHMPELDTELTSEKNKHEMLQIEKAHLEESISVNKNIIQKLKNEIDTCKI